MKTAIAITCLLGVLIFSGCSKDNPVLQPQQEQLENPTAEPEPENQPPTRFLGTEKPTKNSAKRDWSATEVPDGDPITYSIMLGDSLVVSQIETIIELAELVFEEDHEGRIIADDGNGYEEQTPFNLTQDFMPRPLRIRQR